MERKTVKLSTLHQAERNVRRHPEKQVVELARSVELYGQYRPLVVASDGEILVGNGLFLALTELGREEADAYVLPDNAPRSFKDKLMLSDNKIYALGLDNIVNIDGLLASMDDFDIPGFDGDLLADLYTSLKESGKDPVANIGVVTDERREQILSIQREREENPPAERVKEAGHSAYEPDGEDKALGELKREAYVTCPHCGTKVWLQ